VPAQEDVAPGDTLVTSGFGITYPSGIPVAEVVEVETSGDGLVKLVRVEPFVRFSRLEELYLAPGVGRSE
jgi:rod shape-determining protein MreC